MRDLTEEEPVPLSVPFLVDVPLQTADGLLRNVTVYPKTGEGEEEPPEEPDDGGERFIKVDQNDAPLEGALFKVVRRVKNEDGSYRQDAQGSYVYEPVLRDGREIVLRSGPDGRFEKCRGCPSGCTGWWKPRRLRATGF